MKIGGQVFLKKGREASAKRFHPWIFSGAVQMLEGDPKDGDWVEVKDSAKKTLGFGHYQKGTITVRLISFSTEHPGEEIYPNKIRQALNQRMATGVSNELTNCYRLAHGEADGLPGLIIDLYNGVAVMQTYHAGMHRDRQLIVHALKTVLQGNLKSVYYKGQNTATTGESEYLLGMSGVPHLVMEHGKKFYVDWEEGQKTGFFLDQRENRKQVGEMAKGLRVLNTFSYTGGFSVYAIAAGATEVHSVDASEKAVTLCQENISLNGFDPVQHPSFVADTFDFLKDKKDQYDLIILDPPAFAKHKESRHQAMKGYQRLNAEAMRVIKPGGIIFTFSCSQVVDRQLFYDTVVSAALQSGRNIQVLRHLSQPSDHPVSMFHPEGEYLKGLVLYIG